MKFTKSDIKQASSAVSWRVIKFFAFAAKIAFAITLALFLFGAFVYMIGHYFWQCLTLVGLMALASWFYVELVEARSEREHEEFQNEMRKKFKD